jgi:hypothetical protein
MDNDVASSGFIIKWGNAARRHASEFGERIIVKAGSLAKREWVILHVQDDEYRPAWYRSCRYIHRPGLTSVTSYAKERQRGRRLNNKTLMNRQQPLFIIRCKANAVVAESDGGRNACAFTAMLPVYRS